jgi:integrase
MGDVMGDKIVAAHPSKALTAAFVRTATKPGKYFDGNGLYLLVTEAGRRQWVQRIVIRGKRTEIGLGNPELTPLAAARSTALENRSLARKGGDPLQAKRLAAEVPTFAEASKRVHEAHKPTWRNEKHAAQFIATLETYAFPRLGSVKVSDVTSADLLAVLSPIWTTKHETAMRVRQRIGVILKWAIAQGWRQDDPSLFVGSALPKVSRTKAHRAYLPHREVSGFLRALWASGARLQTKLAMEFLILTAARSGEVRGATWDEFDLSDSLLGPVWVIPGGRMKAGVEHRVPLSARAVEILSIARSGASTGRLIFAGQKNGNPISDMTLSKLTKELGYDVDVHGFRTSFKTWAGEKTTFANEVSERALAHTVRNQVEAAYNRTDLFEQRRLMMTQWAEYMGT